MKEKDYGKRGECTKGIHPIAEINYLLSGSNLFGGIT